MDVFLGAEIVEEVRLRHAGGLGDLVDGGPAKPVLGEYLQRRLEDDLALLGLDARPAFRLYRLHGPSLPLATRSAPDFWTNRLDQFAPKLWSARKRRPLR